MSTPTNFQGLKQFGAGIGELKKATAKNAMRRSLKKAAQVVADAAQAMAPVEHGTLKGSIVVSTQLTRRQKRERESKSYVEVHVGPASDGSSGVLNYASFAEFGTADTQPHPYMRPAWENNKERAFGILKTELATEIGKAAARARAKAAK